MTSARSAARPGPRAVPEARLGLARSLRPPHHRAAPPPGRLLRLGARGASPLDAEALGGRAHGLQEPVQQGLIYKGKRLINWCTALPQLGLSDLEVEHEETQGHLWTRALSTELDAEVAQRATSAWPPPRPETILGDTAVAVNPKDTRYTKLVGRIAILPVLGRRIPIVADEAVDPAFGTGAVKVTPAHDPDRLRDRPAPQP